MESKKTQSRQMLELSMKKRDIEISINTLNSQLADRELKLAEADGALLDMNNRVGELQKELDSFDEYVATTTARVGMSIQLTSSSLRCADTVATSILSSVKEATKKIESLFEDIAKAKKTLEEREGAIVTEEHRLAVLKSDLDIYKERLQMKYNENGLGELIV